MRVNLPKSRKNKHGLTIYFSYNTVVAFRGYVSEEKRGLFVRKNTFSNTTGKHLNAIDGGNKKDRLNSEEFERLFAKALRNA